LGRGAVTGIVIGSILGVWLIALGVMILIMRRGKRLFHIQVICGVTGKRVFLGLARILEQQVESSAQN
jgi:hypothetical protein